MFYFPATYLRGNGGPWAGARGRIAWLTWIPVVRCSLVFCVLFSRLLANKRIACLWCAQGLSKVACSLRQWRSSCNIGNWRLLFACQQLVFKGYLNCGLEWPEISLRRENSSQLQQGVAVTEFCIWNASMMTFDASLAYGSAVESNSCWDLNTSLCKKNTINSLIYEAIQEPKCCLQSMVCLINWKVYKSFA